MTLTIAIVGRPNVGKSTLFNRLAGKQLAIVNDTPGVTRDWREAEGWLLDQPVRIYDTAGLEEAFDDSIQGRMRRQTEEALKRADAVLFMIDGRAGLTPIDEHFAAWLRRQKKPVVLAVNKCENTNATQAGVAEAFKLGFGDPIAISSAHGDGIEDLYHAFEPFFPEKPSEEDEADDMIGGASISGDIDAIEGDENYELATEAEEEETKPIKIAIVGRPNVGKSTLVNALLGDHRVMTGPEAGITRDAIAIDWEYEDRKLKLVDTAGLRKKAKSGGGGAIEQMAIEDTMRAIRLAQIVVLVLDANTMMEKQDLQIAAHVLDEGRAMIIAVNKWDTIHEKADVLEELHYKLGVSLAQVKDLPVVTLSAIRGKGLDGLMKKVFETYDIWNKRAPTARLNRWLKMMESRNPPPMVEGRNNRLKYMAQINTRPPTFALWVSRPGELPDTYKRYLSNGLREDFGMKGVPVRLLVRTSKNPYTE